MKSEVDPELLREYIEGDDFAEEEVFARYDRELHVPAELWAGIEERIVPVAKSSAGWWLRIAAVLVLFIGLGFLALMSHEDETIARLELPEVRPVPIKSDVTPAPATRPGIRPGFKLTKNPITADNPGVLSSDLGEFDIDERDTTSHIEQTENLLRSIRNVPVSDTDDEIDVTYDKALSRRLLIENVVLRRDAEMKAKFPTKTLLADLEPFLIDIANLPDQAKPEELRAIKERVQKTEIVAALLDYRDRGPNDR
jgi:hypothetical protein